MEKSSSKDAIDYELELSSGGYGSDILKRDSTAVEEVVEGDYHGNVGRKDLDQAKHQMFWIGHLQMLVEKLSVWSILT